MVIHTSWVVEIVWMKRWELLITSNKELSTSQYPNEITWTSIKINCSIIIIIPSILQLFSEICYTDTKYIIPSFCWSQEHSLICIAWFGNASHNLITHIVQYYILTFVLEYNNNATKITIHTFIGFQ